ncbi:GH25 family lysozyme [Lactobacillus delbrueckii]|uniref:GH25 family lysozyme n=1 Tax=Lactobacillus delbrueckii TaxID=1584 RepID=UPI0017866CA1|nr:GH25 family lysozyme [Lactobacillus delbrueckii]MBD5834695.1 lysin [Lactobacillus delbrueckii]
MARTYGVDVAVYQPTDLARYHKVGASFAIVKLTEGTGYFNPKAQAQVTSARANHLYTHAYHFANFGSSVAQAKKEAKYFLTWAKKTNISKKRMLWLDWEASSANRVDGTRSANTAAILAFMQVIKAAGYRPGLYSGAALMRSAIDTAQVVKKFGTCLWVASYPTMDAVSTANFNYFPSMDGVAIWQFTSNWHGLNVDGNVSLVNLNQATETKKAAPKKVVKAKPKAVETFLVYAPVINSNPNWKIALRDGNGHLTGKYIKTNSRWKVFDTKTMKGGTWYKLGTDQQWAPAAYLKKI